MQQPFYDPTKSYEENFEQGPFGSFADAEVVERDGEPEESFLGHPVYLPFGIPAGPLVNGKYVAAAFQKGFDVCVYKTVRTREYPSHPHPNVVAIEMEGDLTPEKARSPVHSKDDYEPPLSITNSFGVPSMNPDWWQADMKQALDSAGKGQVLVGSFQGTKPESGKPANFVADYVKAAELVVETGVEILEANLSCPNEGTSHLVCFDTATVVDIAKRIKEKVGNVPLLLKLAYFEEASQLAELVEKTADIVDGYAVINTIPATVIDRQGNQALPGEGRAVSGVCGAAIQWAGMEMVERLRALREQTNASFTIVGVGGVTEPEDYFTYRKRGADAVMSATGAMWKPDLAEKIWEMK